MARSFEAELWIAQVQVFNKLCADYIRSRSADFIRAADLRRELALPERVFGEVVRIFRHGDQSAIEVIETDGEAYLRLGESSRYNCD